MLRHLRLFLIIILSLLCVYAINKRPLFTEYANEFCLYVGSNSSNCSFREANEIEYLFSLNVFGEGCRVEKNEFNLSEFLQDFSAEIVKQENIQDVTCVYAYSKKVKYLQIIDGKKVNLHVAITNDGIYLGSPIIYGSF